MAAKTETASERVKVTIPRARPDEDPNLFIGVNGVNYILPKGKTSEVPPEVAYEIERSQAAVDFMYDESDKRKFRNVG
jgi:hypothetical protein